METPNPIAERLSRGAWPPEQAARWLGPGIAIVGAGASLTASLAAGAGIADFILVALAGVELLLLTLYLPACLILAALLTAHVTGAESFAVLRLTGLPGVKVFDGCTQGIGQRMRLLRVVCLWLPGGLAITQMLGATDFSVLLPYIGPAGVEFLTSLSWLGFAGGVLALVMVPFGHLLIEMGVWIGLRWPGRALVISASGVVAAVAVALAGLALGVVYLRRWGVMCSIEPLLGVTILLLLNGVARARAIRYIDGQTRPSEPQP